MKQHRKLLSIAMCFAICLTVIIMLIPSTSFAAEEQSKTVRVAYVLAPAYQEGGEDEYKNGYGYEYLQRISEITDWKYEYVYGTFAELLEKLAYGEVDLMGNLSYTDERAEYISYGDYEQGKENYYLYVNRNHDVIDALDYSTLYGKKIGVNANSIQEKVWKDWCEKNSVNCEIVEFEKSAERQEALNNGKIDATIDVNVQQSDTMADWQVLFKFGDSPFYFGVNKKRPDLLAELNNAQKQILEENPFYNEEVNYAYMNALSQATTSLNTSEKEWLKENNGPVKIGYLEGFQPISYQSKDGTFKGVAADMLIDMEQRYAEEGIHFETIPYQSYDAMISDLKNDKVSAVWAVYKDYWNADQNGFILTNKVMNASMLLVFKGQFTSDTTSKIGINQTGSLSDIYVQINYPESEIVKFDSYEKAIESLTEGTVNSILYESSIYQVDEIEEKDLHTFNTSTLPQTFSISFAVSKNSKVLASILNKGISSYGEAGINRSLLVNSAVERKVTIKEYLAQNPIIAYTVIFIFVAFVAGIILLLVYHKMSIRVKTSETEKEVYERISNSDPVTGLYNRKAVFSKSRELLNEHPGEQFAMIHIDMNHFRLYNTFFGDKVGDQLLCDMADLLRKMSKDYEYAAYGRIEADVFCAFTPYKEERYNNHAIEATNYLKNYRSDFLIEPTLGVYLVTDPEMPIEAMFTRATLAANEVKPGTPYSTVIYDEKLEQELNDNQQIINEMQMAIEEEQFQVYLQPKYSLQTKKVVGAEALVRWIHPTKGMVSPGKFIPVFERNGFINELDRYMWEHVSQILAKWKEEGRTMLPISVNVSRLSMFGSTTVDFLKELVKKYEIDPKYLELELTESAYMDDPEEMKLQMQALKDAGFTILLDDFGSGYSSLNTLRELPVAVLKLDMKFLSVDDKDTRGKIVISSVVRMSKQLNLAVIAEGVELQKQADFLKSIGCEYVQGFLFSRPVPVSEFEEML